MASLGYWYREERASLRLLLRGLLWWRWWALAVLRLVLVIGQSTTWMVDARFVLSKPAFEQAVRELNAGKLQTNRPQWIGLYRVLRIDSFGGDYWFVVGDSIADPVGFEYGGTCKTWTAREL